MTIRVSDRGGSERFYDTVLAPVGIAKSHSGGFYAEWGDFSVAQAHAHKPVTRRLHIGFAAPSRAHVDEFWRVGTQAGYGGDGEPGPRPQYTRDYYGAFLRDPDGNSVEAVHHEHMRGGDIDHLWIRVADLAAAARFYETVAPYAGIEAGTRTAERVQFVGSASTFSLVAGEPTRNAHMAFPTAADETVDAFHAAALAAGYRDNGAPGERDVYHPGYYGAFVLDPDGNNVELVNHNRS